jgi:hypothetical protein
MCAANDGIIVAYELVEELARLGVLNDRRVVVSDCH